MKHKFSTYSFRICLISANANNADRQQKGGNNLPSNVARMARALKKVGIVEHGPHKGEKRVQVVCYQAGVGTSSSSFFDSAFQGKLHLTHEIPVQN